VTVSGYCVAVDRLVLAAVVLAVVVGLDAAADDGLLAVLTADEDVVTAAAVVDEEDVVAADEAEGDAEEAAAIAADEVLAEVVCAETLPVIAEPVTDPVAVVAPPHPANTNSIQSMTRRESRGRTWEIPSQQSATQPPEAAALDDREVRGSQGGTSITGHPFTRRRVTSARDGILTHGAVCTAHSCGTAPDLHRISRGGPALRRGPLASLLQFAHSVAADRANVTG
jgi:hypothetical protein